jgi:Tannase and feruloyl esterase
MSSRLLICMVLMVSTAGYGQSKTCADLTKFQLPGVAVTLIKSQQIPAGTSAQTAPVALPAYCRADGIIDQRTGAAGKRYAIGFAIGLPDNRNGRFLFQGGGALNGTIQEPLGKQSAGAVPALARGFAVVATDAGHQASPFDPSFFHDQEASLNFSYRAAR